jgi:hypothetical protein
LTNGFKYVIIVKTEKQIASNTPQHKKLRKQIVSYYYTIEENQKPNCLKSLYNRRNQKLKIKN